MSVHRSPPPLTVLRPVAGEAAPASPRDRLRRLEEERGRAASAEERVRIDRQLARIWEEELQQAAPAFVALARAVRAAPRDPGLRSALRAAAERCGARLAWARVVAEAALALPAADARPLRAELAAAAEGSPDLDALAWPALLAHHGERLADGAAAGEAAASLQAVERLLSLAPARAGAARLLEDAARESGDPRRLAQVLTIRLEAADPAEEGPLQAELGALCERLGELDGAARALSRACALAHGEGRATLLLRVGRLHAARGALDLAEAWLARAAEGGAPEPLAELARVRARRGDRAGALAALQGQAAREPDPGRRRELLLEVADMRAEQGDVAGAVDACRQLLAVSPDDPQAAALLARLLGTSERWSELDEALGREARAADRRGDPAAAADLEVRRAELRRGRLDDEPGALAALREALRRAPRHPGALAAVEALAAGGGPAAEPACELLDPIFAAERRPDRRAAALGWRLARATDPARRAALLLELSRLRAGPLSDAPGALEAAAAALREDPDAAGALEQVEALAAAAGQPASLRALFGECAARARAPERQVALRRAAARLLAAAAPEDAADAWRRLLRDLPQDLEAWRWLAAWHRARAEAEPLAEALRALEVAEPEEAARAAALDELAAVLEGQGDAAGAAACLRRLAALRPEDRAALSRLDALCAAAGREAELAEVLARELALADRDGDRAAARALRLRLAALRAGPLLDREGAVALAAQVLDEDPGAAEARALLEAAAAAEPGHPVATAALERACERTGDLAGLAAARERRAASAAAPSERKALHLAVAALRERLGDPAGRFEALAGAFREDPGDGALRERLAALAEETGRLGALADLYAAALALLPPSPRAELALALGALAERLDDPERACGAYAEARALDAGAAARALPALERLHAAASRHEPLAEVLEAQARGTSGAARAALLMRLARLHEERLGRPEDALRAWEAARAADPDALEALRALARLDEAAGRRASLCERLAALRAHASDPADRAGLAAREAELLEALGDPAGAAERWRAGLEEPASGWPAATRAERWSHLGELEAGLGEAARAAAAWREALLAEPQYLPALRALRQVHAAAGEPGALQGVLRRLAALEDGEAEGEARLALAEALLSSGERREAAEQGRRALAALSGEAELARLARVFDEAGSAEGAARVAEARAERAATAAAWADAAARWAAAGGAGAREAAALSRALELDPAHRPAWERLRALRAAEGDWRARAALDEAFLPSLPAGERRALRRELARAQEERLREPALAFLGWCRALQEWPEDAEALAEARRLGTETGQLEELAGVVEDLAEAAAGPQRARLLLSLGELRRSGLGDDAGALAAWEAAAEAAPGEPAPLEAIAALQEARGDAAGLVAALERQAEAAAEPARKAALLRRAAALQEERLSDGAGAEGSLRRAWELDPGEGALEPLAGLLARQRRFGDLADLLARAAQAAAPGEPRRALLARLAELRQRELRDDAGAVAAWRDAAAVDPADPGPWRALSALHAAAGRQAEACEALERLAALSPEPGERAEALGRAAALAEEALHDAPRAVAASEALLRLRPGEPAAVARLGRLYRALRRLEPLDALLAARIREAEGEEALALRLERAALLERDLGDRAGAAAVLREALAEAPRSAEALLALCALDEAAGRLGEAAELLARLAALAPDGAARAAALTRLGELHASRRGDAAAAEAVLRQALEADPGHLPALRAARALAESGGDRERAEQLLEAEARHAGSPAEAAALYLGLAARRLDREDGAAAARACAAALERAPGDLDALRLAAELALSLGELSRAHLLLAARVQGLGAAGEVAAPELPPALARLGWVSERLGRAEEARGAFRRALELDPGQRLALAGLARLAAAGGSAEEALRAGEAWRAADPDAAPEVEAVFRAAAARLGGGRVSHA
ncbi:tetratricopeptide repeat protein [Anaeromyxobacter paludicola]|uniref:Tetratricopeptide repeat protein n=1 Tax=Anaeromyxobacter paludicola TaxID=2918171 RepID=A0ABN6N688_9BACT|nr:tetratricopeptide repeat protein [Anaeromyxobacter paludicola]BDG08681.1 hypothetical protein AMPC_17940 [Anaeromyxobacter paludicola]